MTERAKRSRAKGGGHRPTGDETPPAPSAPTSKQLPRETLTTEWDRALDSFSLDQIDRLKKFSTKR